MGQRTSFRKIILRKHFRNPFRLLVFFSFYFLFSLQCFSQPNSCEPIWQPPVRLSFDSVLSISPVIVTSGDTLHILWYGLDTIGGTPNSGIEYCRSTDGGNTFSAQQTIVSANTALQPGLIFCSGNIVCITYFGVANGSVGTIVTRSTDAGTTWQVPQLLKSNTFPRAITGSGTSFYIHYGLQTSAHSGLLASTDSGTSWNTRSSEMPPLQKIQIVGNTFYGVGEYDFGLHQESGYYYSADQGVSWNGPQAIAQENSTPSISPDLSVGKDGTIYTTWNDTGTIMMRRSVGLDADGNLIWESVLTLSDEPGAVSSAIVSQGPFVAVIWGNNTNNNNFIRLRSSNDNAESFCPADSPSVSNQASEPSIFLNDSQLHVVWSENFEGNAEIVYRKAMLQPDLRPKSFILGQNYPNPANRITHISYDLPIPAIVSLRVYNILGQLVSILVNGVQPAASYTIPFSTERLASGVYFYQLRAFPFNETKKFVVLH